MGEDKRKRFDLAISLVVIAASLVQLAACTSGPASTSVQTPAAAQSSSRCPYPEGSTGTLVQQASLNTHSYIASFRYAPDAAPLPVILAQAGGGGVDDFGPPPPEPFGTSITSSPGIYVDTGSTVTFTVKITNIGLCRDTYTTTVHSTHGWVNHANLPPPTLILPQKGITFAVSMSVPHDALPATDEEIDIKVVGQHSHTEWTISNEVACHPKGCLRNQ